MTEIGNTNNGRKPIKSFLRKIKRTESTKKLVNGKNVGNISTSTTSIDAGKEIVLVQIVIEIEVGTSVTSKGIVPFLKTHRTSEKFVSLKETKLVSFVTFEDYQSPQR